MLLALLACVPVVQAERVSAHGAGSHQPTAHQPGYLGVGFHDAGGHGVEVVVVDHDGPAGKAGLRPHDLLMSLNGQPITGSEALSRMIHETAPGVSVTLVVRRETQTLKVTVQIADRLAVERAMRARVEADAAAAPQEADPPVIEFVATDATADTVGDVPEPAASTGKAAAKATSDRSFIGSVLRFAPFTGLALQTMGAQLAEYFGDSRGYGLLVQRVAPNSPAAFCGLRAGDVLLQADAAPLKTASDWTKRLKAAPSQGMSLTVLREHHEITLTLTPEARRHSSVEWPRKAVVGG